MVKISKESLEAFQSALETVDTSWQTEFNLRETVRQSFELIKKAKAHKVSWEKIAEILKQSSGETEGISPESIRQYYFEFSKNPELLPRKKRKPGQSKKGTKDSVSDSSRSKAKQKNPEVPDINQSTSAESELETLSNHPSTQKPTLEEEPEIPMSSSQMYNQPAKTEPDRKAKEDVRSQFNLGRRGK